MEYRSVLCVLFVSYVIIATDARVSHLPREEENTNSQHMSSKETLHLSRSVTVSHRTEDPDTCRIRPTDQLLYEKIRMALKNKVKLVDYMLNFKNYSDDSAVRNTTWEYQSLTWGRKIWAYKPMKWARTSSVHGQTLLALAFNYGVLSLMTLTFGVEVMVVDLEDSPPGCYGELPREEMMEHIIQLLVRDFKDSDEMSLESDERVCHEIIMKDGDYASFRDECCYPNELTGTMVCTTLLQNIWLRLLIGLLSVVRYSILFFGPTLFISSIISLAKQKIPYVVKLKDPLYKSVLVLRSDLPLSMKYIHMLDFRKRKGFHKLRTCAASLPMGEKTKVRFSQYDISVDYSKLLTENYVPVGLTKCLFKACFGCKIKDIQPFKDCCDTNMMRPCGGTSPQPWIKFWKLIGRGLLILCLPFPFYLRLIVYYCFEKSELDKRKAVIDSLLLKEPYDKSLLHFLTPTHPVFLCIYILYFMTAAVMAYMSRSSEEGRFERILVGSFTDLKNQSYLKVLSIIVSNFIWPLKRFGLLGFLFAPFYWVVIMPLSVLFYGLYCLPTIYITFRMMFYSKEAIVNRIMQTKRKKNQRYIIQKQFDDSQKTFHMETLMAKMGDVIEEGDLDSIKSKKSNVSSFYSLATSIQSMAVREMPFCRRCVENLFASMLCVSTLYAVLLILSECIACIVEILVFTTMGIIINAGAVLKYVMLILMVIIYCNDCFNNVPKKYLKLNKAIFNEVKGRCKDLDKVTSLPSYLQENYGFKSQELSEQADYETPDDVSREQPQSWMINDLTLFIDNEDMPRIPVTLFNEVCDIRVAGAPGPVYRSLLDAGKQFLMIVCFLLFVFVIVLSFGAIYQISSTNQMMATVAGGFMPFIMKNFMSPDKPDIEIGTVSFKSKIDEIIKNFYQTWPIFDLPFEVVAEEEEEGGEAKKEGSLQGSGGSEKDKDEGSSGIHDMGGKLHKSDDDQGDQNANIAQPTTPNGGIPGQSILVKSKPYDVEHNVVIQGPDMGGTSMPGFVRGGDKLPAIGFEGIKVDESYIPSYARDKVKLDRAPKTHVAFGEVIQEQPRPQRERGVGFGDVRIEDDPVTVGLHDINAEGLSMSDLNTPMLSDLNWLERVKGLSEYNEDERVDYVIYLPEKCDDAWLREWTEIGEYEQGDVELDELSQSLDARSGSQTQGHAEAEV